MDAFGTPELCSCLWTDVEAVRFFSLRSHIDGFNASTSRDMDICGRGTFVKLAAEMIENRSRLNFWFVFVDNFKFEKK